MLDRYRKFQRLSPGERKLFCESLALLLFVGFAIKGCGFTRSQSILAGLRRVRDAGSEEREIHISAAVRMVGAAARYSFFPANCLNRSLVLWCLLRRLGVDADLRIGVRKNEGRFEAHAWVEWLGKASNDSAPMGERFAAFDRRIRPARAELK